MELIYNGVDLSALGKLQVLSQTGEMWPENEPQNVRQRLRVRIQTREPNYTENFGLVRQARAAVSAKVNGTLLWRENEVELMNQEVTVVSHTWPENPNAWGTYAQSIELEFEFQEALDAAASDARSATVRLNVANAAVVSLGAVEKVKYLVGVNRWDEMRPMVKRSEGRIELQGRFRPDEAGAALATRRSALETQVASARAVLRTGAEIVLNYGTVAVNQAARVEQFSAEVNQASWWVEWSLSVKFTEFPNEGGYAQCSFTATRREEKESGRVLLSLAGEVAASTETRARGKWRLVRNAQLALAPQGGESWVALQTESRAEAVSVDEGEAFIKVTFSEEYARAAGNVLSQDLKISEEEDVANGLRNQVYSGEVLATGSDWTTARATARAKARALGYGKAAMLRRWSEEAGDAQRLNLWRNGRDPSYGDGLVAQVLVRLQFRYEYQALGARIYLEMTSTAQGETWGDEGEQVSGFITGGDLTALRSVYAELRGAYAGKLVRNESFGRPEQQIRNWNYTTDAAATGRTQQILRVDFSFTVALPKSGSRIRYALEVENDYRSGEKTTTVSGTVWAPSGDLVSAEAGQDEDAATVYLNAFLESITAGLNVGSKVRDARSVAAARAPSLAANGTLTGPVLEHFQQMDFTVAWTGLISGAAAVLETEVIERIQPSMDRQVVQPTAESDVVVQTCGRTEGVRQVSGRVKALTEVAAREWLTRQRVLPLPLGVIGSGKKSTLPVVTFATRYLDLASLEAGEAGQRPPAGKVRYVEGTFEFTEIYTSLSPVVA